MFTVPPCLAVPAAGVPPLVVALLVVLLPPPHAASTIAATSITVNAVSLGNLCIVCVPLLISGRARQ
jgi:hypothetical protein